MNLADLTTLRLGGPARQVIEAHSTDDLVEAVRVADEAGDPLLLVAGGSNLVVANAGLDGTALLVRSSGISVDADACSGATVTVQAGETWDNLVLMAIEEGWIGIEALSGIPGSVGATPLQNVGAYGQEVGQTLSRVRAWDRVDRAMRTYFASECGFGYRTSRFKREPHRHVVVDVTFQFRLGDLGAPIAYGELARVLGVEVGERVTAARVREAVLELRRSKGMVLDPADHDTWSAGSFFTNPVLSADAVLPEGAPRFAQADGSVKTSAAWLIEHAGFAKGHGNARAAISSKHTLALTNRGTATTADLLDLAREVRDGVCREFGIELVPEPTLVGVSI